MKIKRWVVTTLLHFYPAAWRREYGPELAHMLLSGPLNARVVTDVLYNGLRQRVHAAEPSTFAGLAAMVGILAELAWNIASHASFGAGLAALLERSSKTLPTVIVRPFASNWYPVFLIGCGCWAYLRTGGKLSRPGVAAMKVSFMAGIPVILAGVLMLFG